MQFNKIDIKNKVTQSNDLVVAQYKLSPNEQKIILLLISLIQPNDTNLKSYKLRVKDLADILRIKNNKFYSEIKTITGNLTSRLINISSPENDLQITWLSSAEYFKNEWCVELSIDPKLRPYLLNLKSNFLSYDLLVAIKFKSSYTIRIFQILLSNNRKYKKKNFTFSLDYLRGLFRLKKNQYPLFANFKARILEPARKELEDKHKDFHFKYNELKEWRKITRIEFIVITSSKKILPPKKEINPLIMAEISKRVPNINEYIEKYCPSIIENNFNYFKEQLDKWKIKAKDNPTAFLIKAIENNYAWNLPSKDLLKSKFDINIEREEAERKRAERKKKFESHLKELFKSKFQSLNEDKKKVLDYDFTQELKKTIHGKNILSKINSNGFDDCFLHFYLFAKKRVLTERDMNFALWDSTQTLF